MTLTHWRNTFEALETHLRIPAARCARGVYELSPHENRGRREYRALDAPAASRAKKTKHTSVVTTGPPGTPGIPCAMVYGLLRALPGDRAFLSPSLAEIGFRQLDASVGASGPHDFAVRKSAPSSLAPPASTASRPNVRDDGQRPSPGTGRRES